jgi:hypothetical protein
MKKCSALILLACIFALLVAEHVAAAPVTWDFIATSCSGNVASRNSGGCEPQQAYPVVLATLTLTGPDSAGSALWGGTGPATYTGDSFALDFSLNYRALTPAFTENPTPFGECEGPHEICQFDLSWSESAGQLDALQIDVNAFNDSFGYSRAFGLSGGSVASDNIYYGAGGAFAGCETEVCQISGYWANVSSVSSLVPAPEPGSLALLASAFGVWGLTGRRRMRRRVLQCNVIE